MSLTPYQITLLRMTVRPRQDGTFGPNYIFISSSGTTAEEMEKLRAQGYVFEKTAHNGSPVDRKFVGTRKAKQLFIEHPEYACAA